MKFFSLPESRRTIALMLCTCVLALTFARQASCAIPPEDA